jgi:hypothetical protein
LLPQYWQPPAQLPASPAGEERGVTLPETGYDHQQAKCALKNYLAKSIFMGKVSALGKNKQF